jgi:hypothetical protein
MLPAQRMSFWPERGQLLLDLFEPALSFFVGNWVLDFQPTQKTAQRSVGPMRLDVFRLGAVVHPPDQVGNTPF